MEVRVRCGTGARERGPCARGHLDGRPHGLRRSAVSAGMNRPVKITLKLGMYVQNKPVTRRNIHRFHADDACTAACVAFKNMLDGMLARGRVESHSSLGGPLRTWWPS